MYLYETHVHTSPISVCAKASVYDTVSYYKSAGYAGIFMSDHFIDGNFELVSRPLPYEERIERYFSAYEEAKEVGEELGIDIFPAIEMSYKGTDFLVYGIDKEWCLSHRDMDKMKKSELLSLMMQDGALLIQAHPFREADYIDHIRLFPRYVHGVGVFNACRKEFENTLAAQYCKNYGLIAFAGTDNHVGGERKLFGGMATDTPVRDVRDFIDLVLSGKAKPFVKDENGVTYI